MRTNKSIDGLSTRDAKKPSFVHATKPKTTSQNLATKTVKRATVKSTTPKTSRPKTIDIAKPTTNSTAKSPVSREQTVEDFLKPVQAFDFDDSGELKQSKDTIKEMKETTKSSKKAKKEKKKPVCVKRRLVF